MIWIEMSVLDSNHVASRMWRYIDIREWEADPNAHWYWTGGQAGYLDRYQAGYGRLPFYPHGKNGKQVSVYAHRWSYEMHRGPIPAGYQVHHVCSIPYCVNPWHLEAVTPSENVRASRLHIGGTYRPRPEKRLCSQGHELTKSYCVECARSERRQAKVERAVGLLRDLGYRVEAPDPDTTPRMVKIR